MERDPNCIFCKIVAGEVAATEVHRDDDVMVVVDVSPQAPKHLLVFPVQHYPDAANFAGYAPPELVAKFFSMGAQLGREQSANGFRLVVNQGSDGGQTINHVHMHVLAGRHFNWPPG
ncbi:MAG: histidine triad nucleotide-binding protein [Vulcanimicrobiaceae bacterium]